MEFKRNLQLFGDLRYLVGFERDPVKRGEYQTRALALQDQMELDFAYALKEIESLRSFKRGVEYALNSGDGTYKP